MQPLPGTALWSAHQLPGSGLDISTAPAKPGVYLWCSHANFRTLRMLCHSIKYRLHTT